MLDQQRWNPQHFSKRRQYIHLADCAKNLKQKKKSILPWKSKKKTIFPLEKNPPIVFNKSQGVLYEVRSEFLYYIT
jgi:hypothetical protein